MNTRRTKWKSWDFWRRWRAGDGGEGEHGGVLELGPGEPEREHADGAAVDHHGEQLVRVHRADADREHHVGRNGVDVLGEHGGAALRNRE